jgi:hypothetical protein
MGGSERKTKISGKAELVLLTFQIHQFGFRVVQKNSPRYSQTFGDCNDAQNTSDRFWIRSAANSSRAIFPRSSSARR